MRRKMYLSYIAIISIIFASENCLALDPSQDLGEKAAALANEVLGVPYLSGGQGWDLKDNKFVESKDIIEGYNYYDSATQSIKKGKGLDCSGLVYWAYNKAYGVNSEDIKRGKSEECLNCPIGWFTADGIGYETDKTKIISHIPEKKIDENGKYLPIHMEPPEESALKPGDLLFLDTKIETAGCPSPGFGCIDHVGMYVGSNGYVIHASGDNLIEIEPKGSTGTIVDGPIKSADGETWYNINYKDGTAGWSMESQLKFSSTNTNEIETIVDAKVRFTPGKKSEVTKLKYNQWLNLKVDGEKTYRDYFAGYGRVIENLAVSAATIGIPPTINQDSLEQLRQNGDAVTIGEKLTDTTVAFRAELSNSYGKMIKLQVELRRLDEYEHNFLDSEGHESDFKNSEFVTSGSEATAYAYGLIDGDYHWRARAVNEDGIASEWVDFGGNDISEADFTVSDNDVITWTAKGNALYYQAKYDEALQAYEKAIELDPNSANAWTGKGNALAYLARYDESLQAYEKAIELNPNFSYAWTGKGTALAYLAKYDEALQAYEKAIELDPNFANAWQGKGNALYMQNRNDEALQAYEKAIELDPNSANAWTGKGCVLDCLARYDEAIKCQDEAIRLNPEVGIYWSNKGDTLKSNGKYNEADTYYAKAKELGYVSPGYKTIGKLTKN